MALVAQQSDDHLGRLLVAGDLDAIDRLYDRYGRLAFGLAYRILEEPMAAENVVRDAFVSLWRAAGSFSGSYGDIRGWLLQIVRNRAIGQLRSSTDPGGRGTDDVAQSVEDWPRNQVEADADPSRVHAVLQSLPQGQRRAIELSYYGGLSPARVATMMGLSLATVMGRQQLGLQNLRLALDAATLSAGK